MEIIQKKIELKYENGNLLDAELVCSEDDSFDSEMVVVRLSFSGRNIEARSNIGFFDALLDIRKELEKIGLLIICYGASRNVYPSGMSRSMGSGEKAYKLTFGKQALNKDIVKIFDDGPDVDPATIEEQEAYFDKWLKSLGGK